ncbi:hypothetical protein ACFFQW_01570 [Umezawaea endophytica]|uniref:N-acetyltransferase domain-containing protein n=1 Tax=Umezawaea endophytica TaxID=1654476 RepID=A0A9X3AEJ9_9PSEU|nr:hypothetical protein [Umezawaea endophytica]MCS7476941.1 hypothetical protein [Umezawaea endophytica]
MATPVGSPHATATDHVDLVARPSRDRAEVVDILTAAFADDPVYTWAIPRTLTDRERFLRAYLRAEVDLALDHGGTAAVSADRTGATVWYSPDTAPGPEACQRFRDRVTATTGPANERCLHLARIQPADPATLPRHVYSAFTGVLPQAQGKGTSIGLALAVITSCLDHGAGMFAVATSARNAALWNRYGAYQCADTIPLPDDRTGLIPILIDPDRIEDTLTQLHDFAAQRDRRART